MFANALPLDFKNHNYLYNMVKTKNHIKNAVTDTTTNTDTDLWDNRYFLVYFLLVILVMSIISRLVNIVKEAWCSNSVNEKTRLLKNKNPKNNNNFKPPKMV